MHGAMVRLSHAVRRRRWIVIGAWIALVAFSAPFARMNGDNLSAGFTGVEGSQSETVQEALDAGDFGDAGNPSIGVVVEPADGATPQQLTAAVNRIDRAAQQNDEIVFPQAAVQQADQQAQAGQPFIVQLRVDATQSESIDVVDAFSDDVDAGDVVNGVTLYVFGQSSLQAEQVDESQSGTETASDVSLAVMLVLLLATFGGLVATLVPLVLGFASVVVTGMAIYFLSQELTISIFATSLAAMIGLAVAVDYSLFILLRYREELVRGADRVRALEVAMSTSLIAVIFSGTTVMVSLAGLFLVPNATVRSMAVGAIIVVAVSLLAAATLLAALVAVLGRLVEGPGPVGQWLSRLGAFLSRGQTTSFWERQTARATRFPWLTVGGTLAVLVLIALPTFALTLNESSVQQLSEDNQARQGTELAGQIAGLGATAPTLVLVQLDQGQVTSQANQQALGQIKAVLDAEPGVHSETGPQPSTDNRSALYTVQLVHSPETEQAKDTVRHLRDDLAASPAADAAAVSVGGLTASEVDFRDSISGSMWKIVLFILATAFLVLLVLLRSLVLPLVGVAMNILCVGASYGVLVAVFQWGWFGFLGLTDFGYVNSVILPLLLAVVFGLSMDYQVFLLTRIRERYLGGTPTREAAREGTSAAARTITAAAAIMVGVFLVFVVFGVPTIQAAGLGAAVAVVASALLVQLAFMPSLIVLLGDRVWWLPGWLDRLLPRIELD
jgi:RND superfamily putative drug exporter